MNKIIYSREQKAMLNQIEKGEKIREHMITDKHIPEVMKPTMNKDCCPNCGSSEDFLDVRGQILCLRCQLDRIWDYIEGTRRMVEGKGI